MAAIRPVVLASFIALGTGFGWAQTSGATACKPTVTGTIDITEMKSSVFSNTRNLRIWLPPGYHDRANENRTYPVLFLLDGQMLFDRCTAPGQSAEWGIDESLTQLIGQSKVEPLIVVGIDNTGPTRSREFSAFRSPLPPYEPLSPEGDRFPDFMVNEVLPLINDRYRIAKGRETTGIGGSSLGAAAVLYTVLHRPDIFGLVLLESTSLQLGNGQLIRETSPIIVGPIRAWIGVGTEELGPKVSDMLGVPQADQGFVELSRTLAANLRAALFNKPEVRLDVEIGAHHAAQYWGGRFPAAIEFLYPPHPK